VRILWQLFIATVLTALTQVGGVIWLVSRLARRKLLTFALLYVATTLSLPLVVPSFGRVALPCLSDGEMVMQSPLYCALNRHYVTPDTARALERASERVAEAYPGTKTLILDGNFPFFDGFPLLPHLSHDDGEKADLAFYYRDDKGYLPGATRSPIGYFAFEQGPTDCPKRRASMRWDLEPLQPLWRDYEVEPQRTRAVLRALLADEAVGKVFLEPHLQRWLGLSHPKLRFQGCRAARHDDHIHIQLK